MHSLPEVVSFPEVVVEEIYLWWYIRPTHLQLHLVVTQHSAVCWGVQLFKYLKCSRHRPPPFLFQVLHMCTKATGLDGYFCHWGKFLVCENLLWEKHHSVRSWDAFVLCLKKMGTRLEHLLISYIVFCSIDCLVLDQLVTRSPFLRSFAPPVSCSCVSL